MINEIAVGVFGTVLGIMLLWSFRTLPKEQWQIIGSLTSRKNPDGTWTGQNLTYYGLFNANAYVLATLVVLVLMASVRVPPLDTLLVTGTVLGVCIPASRWTARMVEKKAYTFSVGGASFVGILLVPMVVWLYSRLGIVDTAAITFLGAVSIAFSFGEGVGRLACISFGCCYGKPISALSPRWHQLFYRCHFVFTGSTKKCAYAHGLDGQPVVPVQAITAVLYCVAGLAGSYLFLAGNHRAAFLLPLTVTQIWRFLSEFLRADYRGGGRISAYQWMGLAGVAVGTVIAVIVPASEIPVADIRAGVMAMWDPLTICLLQALWVITFLYTGRSKVTGATLRFFVHDHRV